MNLQRLGVLLQECSKAKALTNGLIIHGITIKSGLVWDIFMCNHLINLYAKCGDLVSAHQLFGFMPHRNLVTWSALISGYHQAGKPAMALSVFSRMLLQPNEFVYASVISACSSLLALSCGKQVHAHSFKTGYSSVSFVSNSLVSMYMKCGVVDDALLVFHSVSNPDGTAYNAMIAGFAESLWPDKGLELFRLMCEEGLRPDQFSFVALLEISSSTEDMQMGTMLHCQAIKVGLDSTTFVGNVILTVYSEGNLIGEVEKAFLSIEVRDVISWNTFIVSCCQCGEHAKALMAYRDMEEDMDVCPDDFTLASALSACAELASSRCGSQIHGHLIRTRLDCDVGVGNALINMYAKCGCIMQADNVFHQMLSRNLVSWNTMIAGLGNHGLGKKAIEMFDQMGITGVKPDSVTFIGLLAACSHGGLVDEGISYYDSMKEVYGISPRIEHLSCLIDMLGRAARLAEAEDYIKSSSFRNDFVSWGSLLSSCRLHKDFTVGERAAKKLLELQPSSSSPFVLLSNLYASDGRWDGVMEARKLLRGSGVKKEPGCSWIEEKGVLQKFAVGDFSHARIEEMKEILDTLNIEARKLIL